MQIVNFGYHPISNRFLTKNEEKPSSFYPIKVCCNQQTGLISLCDPFPIDEIKPRYDWLTCFEPEDHLNDLVKKIISLPGISKSSIMGGYSFKDDTTLKRLKSFGYDIQWRIDPFLDLEIRDKCAGVETFQNKFNLACAKKIAKKNKKADVLIIRHVLEHAYDLGGFIAAVSELVTTDGYVIWEIPDCARSLDIGDCTMLWEEHIHYFTSTSFIKILKLHSYEIVDFYTVSYPLENSLIAITKLNEIKFDGFMDSCAREPDLLSVYSSKLYKRKQNIKKILLDIKSKTGKGICIFGAGHLSVTFIALLEIQDLIEFVVDENPNKQDKLLPLGNIQIKNSNYLLQSGVKVCLLGINPHNHEPVISKHSEFQEIGGKFGSIFPGTKNYIEDIYDVD